MVRRWRMAVAEPFGALFLLRRRYFSLQSRALYARYAHALTICLALFGLVLVERPTLLAAPILHFWRDPGDWQAGLAYGAGWLLSIAVWARVHRSFVRGATLAEFARASVHGRRVAPVLDIALLLVALQWWALPFAIAFWTVATSDAPPSGADGRFPLYVVLLILATLAVAYAVVFNASPARGPRRAGASGVLRAPALGFLTLLHVRALWRGHLHVALPRAGVALLVHAASWWMIHQVGKHRDAAGFIALACCVTAYALAGLYDAFWRARQPLEPYLRSMPFGVARMRVAEHLVVLGVGGIVCALVWSGYGAAPAAPADLLPLLARCIGVSLLLLRLLGAPILQRHHYGAAFKVALSVATLFLMGTIA
ncbi:hypothetical protein AB2N08_03175 [Massilia aurea]|uniref:hypothetical protein n=1 Tax=Massilia aurea TaxID=373040 RepID=UPI003462C6E2